MRGFSPTALLGLVALGFLAASAPHSAQALPCAWDADNECMETSTQHFTIHHALHNQKKALSLARWVDQELVKNGREMGQSEAVLADPRITIRLAPDEATFFAAQPDKSRIPEWAAGVAYGDRHLIVLSLATSHYFNLNEIARHEISHVAVRRAAGTRIPRWLDEGLAILHAGEHVQSRILKADGAALTGTLLPFKELTRGFPRAGSRAELAYAQSYRFVHWLMNSQGLSQRLPLLLDAVRSGRPFNDAFADVMDEPLPFVEARWITHLETSATWLAFLMDPEWLWGFAGLLFLLAYGIRRRKISREIAAMDSDEEEEAWPPHELPNLQPPSDSSD